jgi:peroxiredoxin
MMEYPNLNSKYMKIVWLLLILIAVVSLDYISGSKERPHSVLTSGQRFPSINVFSSSGKEESFDARIQKNMILVVFSTTCIHCLDAMKYWNEYSSGGDDSVEVNGLSTDERESTAEFVKEHNVTFSVFTCAPSIVTDTLHVRSVPMVFFIDRVKIVRRVIFGNQSKEIVTRHLNEFLQR